MRIVARAILLFSMTFHVNAQEREQWQRIYTYEDSSLEIDAANVVFGTDFTGRLRFRFLYSKPQPLSARKGHKYLSVIQTMEFKCPNRLYRVVSVERLDSKGKRVDKDEAALSGEWKPVKIASMIDRLFQPGCDLIYEKKRNP